MTAVNYLVLGLSAAAAVYGASYFMKMNRLRNEMDAVIKVNIHKVTISGIDLRINVTLKNPSGGTVNVKQPFVKLLYGDSTVASSEMRNVNISIPKFSEVKLNPITLNISFLSLITTAPALLKEYRENGVMTLTVNTVTTINDSIPYSRSDKIKLGGGKVA